MNFVVLHGTGATHESNWFPWLKSELESHGHSVWVPDLPNSDTPNATAWTDYLIDSEYDFNDTTIIGHSAGAVEIQALLQTLPSETVLNTAILVGAFRGDLNWESLIGMDVPFDYDAIKQHAKQFLVVHSDDDPNCPLEGAELIGQLLGAEFVLFPNMGHFSMVQDARFKAFPELLDLIQEKVL